MIGAILCSHLTSEAAAFKDEFWEDEHEWRITLSLYGDPSDRQAIQRSSSGHDYVQVEFPGQKLPITRVVVGPLMSRDEELSVKQILSSYGYDVPTTRSDVPLQ